MKFNTALEMNKKKIESTQANREETVSSACTRLRSECMLVEFSFIFFFFQPPVPFYIFLVFVDA